MPRFRFVYWEEAKYFVEFDADNLEQAKELIDGSVDVDDLPNVEKNWRKGSEELDAGSLTQITEDESENEE